MTAKKTKTAKKKTSKKKAAPKKKAAKKKKSVSTGLWLDLNFPDGTIVAGSQNNLTSTRNEVEAYYVLELQQICQTLAIEYTIHHFDWTEISGAPRVTKLEVYVSPKPVRLRRPGGGFSNVKPPTPPPPPPPYLS